MSIEALVWAFRLPVKPASRKLTLIALADAANHSHEAWPCIEALVEKTSLDRKTLIAALDSLEDACMIADTGKRVGATRQVKVYRMTGLQEGSTHYTYRVTDSDTGEFYVGVRSCWKEVEQDSAYMGSGKWPLASVRACRPLVKRVLAVHATRAEAEVAEMVAIRECATDPLNRNELGAKSYKNGTIPKTEQFRFPPERVPETGHGIQRTQTQQEEGEGSPSLESKAAGKKKLEGLAFDATTGHFHGPISDHFSRWKRAFPALDLDVELARAEAWLVANPANRKSNYLRFLTNWLQRAQDRAPRLAAQTGAPHGSSHGSPASDRRAFADDMRAAAAPGSHSRH
jgi:hypothetical protein